MKDKSLVVVQPWRDLRVKHHWHVLAWARVEDGTRALEHVLKTATEVSPLWWTIDEQGELRSHVEAETVSVLRKNGIAVWPAVQGLDADGLHTLLMSAVRRSEVTALISSEAQKLGTQGVNIDLEGFRIEDSDEATAFVEELAALIHTWGGIVSYDLVARSDKWQTLPMELSYWSSAPQRRRLAAAVDYTILMAYDQFNDHRPAGPVAAPNWVEEVLVYLLRYADPQSVMLGIPAYGRLWNPEALNVARAVSLSQLEGHDGVVSFDKAHCLRRICWRRRQFLLGRAGTQSTRIKLALDFHLAGVAIWRLGLDYPELWQKIRTLEQSRDLLINNIMDLLLDWSSRQNTMPDLGTSCVNPAN